jgi:uncharacterized protein (DUF362 family)
MTIFADYSFMFIVGMLYSLMNYDLIRRSGSIFKNKYFLYALVYQVVFMMPLAIISYVFYPDWCWMYYVEAKAVPIWGTILAYSLYYILYIAGYGIGYLAENKSRGSAMNILFLSIIFFGIFSIITYDRLFYVGTIGQYNSGTIPSIRELPLWYLTIMGGIGISMLALVILLYKMGKILDSPWGENDQTCLDDKRRVVSLAKVSGDVKASISESLDHWDGKDYIKKLLEERDYNVIIKPNFCGGGRDKEGTQTSLEVLSAAIDIIREISQKAKIMIVESDSIFWDVHVVLKKSKYQQLFNEKDVEFINLSKGKKTFHDFGGRMGGEIVPKLLLEPHVLVDIPVAKTHSFYVMSGAIKNLLGLVPAKHKFLRYHAKGFGDNQGRIFIDIYRSFMPDIVILDGVVSCEGNGPYGTPKRTNFILTSDDAISTDLILAQIIGLKEEKIPYLYAINKEGLKCDINLLGESIDAIKPAKWKRAKPILGMVFNVLKIWRDNLKVRVLMEKRRRFIFIVLMTLLFAFVLEMINAFVVKWWIYSYPWTFVTIIIIWLILGILLASLNIKNKRWATGPVFALWGLIVESLNLLFFQEWYFTSEVGLIGTFIVWVLFGALFYGMYLASRKFSKKITS